VFLVIMLLMPRGIIPSVRDLVVSHNPFDRPAGDGESEPRTSGVAT
jgi:hypothetical protein